MQSEPRTPDEWSHAERPGEASVSVLTGVPGAPSALRLGAGVFPLGHWMARRQAVVGAEVGVTASLLDQLPLADTVVAVVAPQVDVDAVVDQVMLAAHAILTPPGSLTVGIADPVPVTGGAETLVMYNQHLDALPEALLETVAVGRRQGHTTALGNCVLTLQRFVPATATAIVRVHPDRQRAVRIDGRWGVAEAAASPADVFEVPATGAIRERLAVKPTAHVLAHGGTHEVPLPVDWRRRFSLSRAMVRRLAALARDAASTVGRSLVLDVALTPAGPVVLRCRRSVS